MLQIHVLSTMLHLDIAYCWYCIFYSLLEEQHHPFLKIIPLELMLAFDVMPHMIYCQQYSCLILHDMQCILLILHILQSVRGTTGRSHYFPIAVWSLRGGVSHLYTSFLCWWWCWRSWWCSNDYDFSGDMMMKKMILVPSGKDVT